MKYFLCFILSVITHQAFSQFTGCCKDSTRIPDTYYQCNMPEYDPVCGCDNLTYRNSCAAEWWGGLLNNGFCIGWVDQTICGNFDFEFNPTAVSIEPVRFNLYMKSPGSATLYIYDAMGGLQFSAYFNATYPDQKIYREISFNGLRLGVYVAVVVVNGEKQAKKFVIIRQSTQ